MSSTTSLRPLKIKTGVVQRLLKDLKSYRQELEDNKRDVEKVRASRDHSMLKQLQMVVGETQAMMPDTTDRLCEAIDDLNNLLASPEYAAADTVDLADARGVISAAEALLQPKS